MAGRFARKRDGTFAVRLVPEERDAIRDLPERLKEVLSSHEPRDPGLNRLFPPAVLDDDVAARAFDELTHDDLARRRGDAADVMAASIDSATLTEEELTAWLSVINDTRLVLAARLELDESSQPGDFTGEAQRAFLLYRYLTDLTTQMVRALSGITEMSLLRDVLRRERARGTD